MATASIQERQRQWAEQVERWQRSGVSAREFARKEGVNPKTLGYWRWRLEQESQETESNGAADGRAVQFVELGTSGDDKRSVFEFELRGGLRVRIPFDFEREALIRLLDVVEGRQ